MLSDRLLSLIDYETLKESEILELLKRRFGEQSLQNCQIMIKDMKDSNRIDIQYHKVTPEFPLHSFILSYLFWPSFIDIPLTLPAPIQQSFFSFLFLLFILYLLFFLLFLFLLMIMIINQLKK